MLLLAIYMIILHLIIHGRWRNVYLATFYGLTCILCVAKITFLTTFFKGIEDAQDYWIFFVSDRINLSCKVFLELCQIAQMVKLAF